MELVEFLLLGIFLATCVSGAALFIYIKNIDNNLISINHNIILIVKGNDDNFKQLEDIKNKIEKNS